MLRRPTFTPMENAPSAHKLIGTDGCPIRPCTRVRAPRMSRPSSINRSTISEVVCVLRCVSRAISAFGSGP